MSILMVLTSHDRLGDTGRKTGFWLEEFAAPYYVFKDARLDIVLASPKGGQPPVDPKSDEPKNQTEATRRFMGDKGARTALANTRNLSTIAPLDYDAVFYPGGHGPLWDIAEDAYSIAIIETMFAAGRPIAAVCHGPGAFRHAKGPGRTSVVNGRRVTGFANSEEEAVGLTQVVPFLVEDMLKESGGHHSKGPDWQSRMQTDGNLVPGQNPASSEPAARALLPLLPARHDTAPAPLQTAGT